MSRLPRRRSLSLDPVSTARETIRAAGLRCTPARIAVLQSLVEVARPATHAELSALLSVKAGGSGFDKATVYRNLVELTQAGILSRIEVGDHVWRFEVRPRAADGAPADEHAHFVCTQCGSVACLDDVEVKLMPRAGVVRKGGKMPGRMGTVNQVLLKGRCEDCG